MSSGKSHAECDVSRSGGAGRRRRGGAGRRGAGGAARRRGAGTTKAAHTVDGLLKNVLRDCTLVRLSDASTHRLSGFAQRGLRLAAKAETLDERAVTADVDVLQVTQQATTLTDEQEQPRSEEH